MAGKHAHTPLHPAPVIWDNSYLTATEARAMRAQDHTGAIPGARAPELNIDRSTYTALQSAHNRPAYLEAIKARTRARRNRTIGALILGLIIIAGIVGLALTAPLPLIG